MFIFTNEGLARHPTNTHMSSFETTRILRLVEFWKLMKNFALFSYTPEIVYACLSEN